MYSHCLAILRMGFRPTRRRLQAAIKAQGTEAYRGVLIDAFLRNYIIILPDGRTWVLDPDTSGTHLGLNSKPTPDTRSVLKNGGRDTFHNPVDNQPGLYTRGSQTSNYVNTTTETTVSVLAAATGDAEREIVETLEKRLPIDATQETLFGELTSFASPLQRPNVDPEGRAQSSASAPKQRRLPFPPSAELVAAKSVLDRIWPLVEPLVSETRTRWTSKNSLATQDMLKARASRFASLDECADDLVEQHARISNAEGAPIFSMSFLQRKLNADAAPRQRQNEREAWKKRFKMDNDAEYAATSGAAVREAGGW
jgi:hypothetical protein